MFTFKFLKRFLYKKTDIFGLKVWIVIASAIGFGIVLFLLLLPLCYSTSRHRRRRKSTGKVLSLNCATPTDPIPPRVLENTPPETSQQKEETRIEIEKNESDGGAHRVSGGGGAAVAGPSDASCLSWGRWFPLRELEVATGGFAEENVIGEGGYGIVYRGVLGDETQVAVKNLLKNSAQVEREFRVEVEAIGRVRHKNLVRLLGYCDEGENRMLVYEYVDNRNLDQWLHGDVEEASPMTWEIRMNILLGTAKGLTYLHEGLEPKVVHRDIKASNILVDRQWNPKVSDFGIAKLLCSERTYVTTRVMGTFGYVAPEYASTGMLNESSDVYSFGVLMMEMISGRIPVDYTQPSGEMHLVEWLKALVSERKYEQVLDPKMSEKPSSKSLKRALLVALRCVDPDSSQRPKMGHVIHLLEMDDLQYRDDYKLGREVTSRRTYSDKHSMDRYSISELGSFDRDEISFGMR